MNALLEVTTGRWLAGQILVVKYGGAAMVDADLRAACLEDVAWMHAQGAQVVLVHGGGPEVSEEMRRQGLEPRFVDGLRVTDEATLAVAQKVLVGQTNRAVVTALLGLGVRAVGLSGQDGGTVVVVPRRHVSRETGEEVDLGRVGEVARVDTDLLDTLLGAGFLPVLSPLGADERGLAYNVNADTVAAAVACALGADRLVLLTDVDGIRADPNEAATALRACTSSDLQALLDEGAVKGGMVPKVEAVLQTLEAGVKAVQVLDGRRAHALRQALEPLGAPGTTVTAD